MAVIKKDGNFMGLPMNVARGNPIPLDKSEIWYSYAEMETYAKTDPVAYVGQILGLVDETLGTATAYIILNTAGDLQEIGASIDIPSLMGDNASIVISNDIIALKNWGVQYYKYIAATEDEEAHYEIQVVDEENPWIAGLEPKAAFENGQLVLGWYQPNPTTIEGVSSQLGTLQTAVNDLKASTYTKTEVDSKIANAAHLKRVIVSSKDDIDVNAADADQYIYMALSSPEDTDDKYDEYMVIIITDDNGDEIRFVEKVGSWKVDLSNYVTIDELNKKVDKEDGKRLITAAEATKLAGIAEGAQVNYISSVDNTNFKVEAGKLILQEILVSQVQNLQQLLDDKVSKETGKGLSSNDFTDEHIQIITGNVTNVQTLNNKILVVEQALNGVDDKPGLIAQVGTLTTSVQTNADAIEQHEITIGNLSNTVSQHGEKLVTLDSTVTTLQNTINAIDLAKYVTVEVFQATVGNLEELQQNTKTLHTQVKEIQNAITWGQIEITT